MGARFEDHSRLVLSRIHEAVAEASNAVAITYANLVVRSFKGASNIGAANRGSSPPGSPPAVNTGELRRSFSYDSGGQPQAAHGMNDAIGVGLKRRVGTRLIYAKTQEFGGPGGFITMRDKKLLVPIGIEGQRLVQRYGRPKGSIRSQKLVPIIRPGKDMLLAKVFGRGKNAVIKPVIVLKERVKAPARPYMRPAAAALPGPAIKAAKRALTLGLKKRGLI